MKQDSILVSRNKKNKKIKESKKLVRKMRKSRIEAYQFF